MMKAIIYISLAALTFLAAACSTNDDTAGNYPSDGVVRITTDVSEPVSRAATGYTDYQGTSLGLCIANSSNTKYSYSNVQWTWTSTKSSWSPATQMLWQNATTPVTVYAYAPYQANADVENLTFSVNTDQRANGTLSSDLVRYCNSSTAAAPSTFLSNEAIPVHFAHRLSQLIVKLSYADEFGTQTPAVKDVRIINAVTNYGMNVATGDVNSLTKEMNDVVMYPDVASSHYTAIVPSQTFSSGATMLRITMTDGRIFNYVPASDQQLASDYSYTFNLRIGKDKISLASEISVSDWDNNSGSNYGISGGKATAMLDAVNHKITTVKSGSITAADINTVLADGTRVLFVDGPVNAADLTLIATTLTNGKKIIVADLRSTTLDNNDGKLTNFDISGSDFADIKFIFTSNYEQGSIFLHWNVGSNTIYYNGEFQNTYNGRRYDLAGFGYAPPYYYCYWVAVDPTLRTYADALAAATSNGDKLLFSQETNSNVYYEISKFLAGYLPLNSYYWIDGGTQQLQRVNTGAVLINSGDSNFQTTAASILYRTTNLLD